MLTQGLWVDSKLYFNSCWKPTSLQWWGKYVQSTSSDPPQNPFEGQITSLQIETTNKYKILQDKELPPIHDF